MPDYITKVQQVADRLAAALEAVGTVGSLASNMGDWDSDMQRCAGVARYNGGTADSPRNRHGITEWDESTNKNRWDFDRMRFNSLKPLAMGWIHTRESDYALAARDYIEGWIDSHPRPQDEFRLNTAIRINLHGPQGWLGTLPFFLNSPVFDEAFVERMVEFVRRDLEWMREAPAASANIRLFQADSLLWAGLRLSFVPEADAWRRQGVQMLNDAFHRMFAADGSNVEKDPHYVGVYLAIYAEVPLWAKAFPELGLRVKPEPIARMFDYQLCGTKPNGYESGLHDSVSAWEGHRDNAVLAKRDLFIKQNHLLEEFPPTSTFFPDAGQAYLRTGWDQGATMVTFDGTRQMNAHNHLGMNSIQLHAYGRTLLMDPGILTYHMGHLGGTETDQLAGPHGKSTRAHNTLNLNGWNQWMTSPEFMRHWHAPSFDTVVCRYNGGYWPGRFGWWFFEGAGHGLAAVHERILFWMHDRALIVIDFLMRWEEKTAVDSAHQSPALEANWQFSPGLLNVDPSARRVTTDHEDANVLMLFPVVPAGTQFEIHEGEMDPFRGWIGEPTRDHRYRPAPQLALTASPMCEHYAHLVTVIVPYQGQNAPQLTADAIPTEGPGSIKPGHLRLSWGDGTTDEVWWMHGLEGGIVAAGDFETDASLVQLRRDSSGLLLGGSGMNGTYCSPHFPETLETPAAFKF